jgi:hypothetical protein
MAAHKVHPAGRASTERRAGAKALLELFSNQFSALSLCFHIKSWLDEGTRKPSRLVKTEWQRSLRQNRIRM